MTPRRMQECLDLIRWPPATFAASLDADGEVVERWLDGTDGIPISVASWLEALCFTHEASNIMRPALKESAHPSTEQESRPEHVPVYSYNLLRSLERSPVLLRSLFGTDDEGAVFFLVSRGLAEREGEYLIITQAGQRVGRVTR